ncbi:hypothetical protein LINPERHAP2_LOCUS34000 [Linum perenne]
MSPLLHSNHKFFNLLTLPLMRFEDLFDLLDQIRNGWQPNCGFRYWIQIFEFYMLTNLIIKKWNGRLQKDTIILIEEHPNFRQ